MLRSWCLSRYDLRHIREAVPHGGKDQAVIAPETLTATHGLEQQDWKDEALGQGAATRTESSLAATVFATIRLNKDRVCGVVHDYTSERGTDEGATEPIECILHLGTRGCIPAGFRLRALGVRPRTSDLGRNHLPTCRLRTNRRWSRSRKGTRNFCSTSGAVVRFKIASPLTAPITASQCRAWAPLQ